MIPVVLLHGSNSWGEELSPLAQALARNGIQARMPNLLGHGGRPVPASWTFGDFADDLIARLDAERIERARFVGYSTGAYLALFLARHHASRVESVVAIAAKYVIDAKTIEHWAYLTSLERFLEPGHPRVPLYERHHADWKTMTQNNNRMFRAWADGAPLTEADLAQIGVPVMVIGGDRDPLVSWNETRALGRLIPGAHVAMCYGSSHPISAMPLNGVAQAIARWMERATDRPPAG